MVIPAVGVAVGDDDRRRIPKLRLFDEVDRVDQELLLVQRIGFSGVPALDGRRFQEAYRWHVAGVHRIDEVMYIVLMVGLVAIPADSLDGRRAYVRGIRCRWIILKRLAVRTLVVIILHFGDLGRAAAVAAASAVRICDRQVKAG
jgi:hypothetical protein